MTRQSPPPALQQALDAACGLPASMAAFLDAPTTEQAMVWSERLAQLHAAVSAPPHAPQLAMTRYLLWCLLSDMQAVVALARQGRLPQARELLTSTRPLLSQIARVARRQGLDVGPTCGATP